MTNKNIKIYARIKPDRCQKQTHYEIYQKQHKDELVIYPPRLMNQSINNSPYKYSFHFDKIFQCNCDQMEIFETIAIPILDRIKKGSNGTIFAYGQTGTGKTFTMLGSILPNSYRGIIPRILQDLFNDASTLRMALSYLEIYKDVGVDLLSRNCQRVTLQEDDAGVHLKHLQKVYVQDMTEAMKILQIGEENRKVSCNRYNTRSSRSHCILTIRYEGSHDDKVVLSYLHLVDLAGSERFKAPHRASDESIHINKSLHFLEVVINALTYPTLRHVPYRNSLVTSVLKDSLNANSFTSMIATLSMAEANAFETLSSCRFASRMSRIKNTRMSVGKENKYSRKSQMLSLQGEVERLHGLLNKNSNVKSQSYDNDLTDEDKRYCETVVSKFLSEDGDSSNIPVTECKHIQECFRIIRTRVQQIQKQLAMGHNDEKEHQTEEMKQDFKEEFPLKPSKKKGKNDILYPITYEGQSVRMGSFIPNSCPSLNIKYSRVNKTRRANRRKTVDTRNNKPAHKTGLNFDEYLEKNPHLPNNNHSSIFLKSKIGNTKSPFSSNCTPCVSTCRTNRGNGSMISITKIPPAKKSTSYLTNSKKHIYPNERLCNSSENNLHSLTTPKEVTSCCSHLPTSHPLPCLKSKSSCCQQQCRNVYQPEPCCGANLSARSNCSYITNPYTIQCRLNSTPEFLKWSSLPHNINQNYNTPSCCFNHRANEHGDAGMNATNLEQHFCPVIAEPICEENLANDDTIRFIEVGHQGELKPAIESKPSKPLQIIQNDVQRQEPITIQNSTSFTETSGNNLELSKPNDLQDLLSKITLGEIADYTMNPYVNSLRFTQKSLDDATLPKNSFKRVNTNPFLKDIEEQQYNNPNTISDYSPRYSYTDNQIASNLSISQSYDAPWTPSISFNNQRINQDSPRRNIYTETSEKCYMVPGTDIKVPLTGDNEIDEEIIKFYKCRELAKITKVS